MGTGVVVGYDGSEHSSIAVDWAAAEAVSRGVMLTLTAATTVPMEGMRFGGSILSPDAIDDLLGRLQEATQARADEARKAHPGLVVDVKVALGSPAAVLVEASANADMVVVGSRGMGGFRGLLVGSVGVQVASNSECTAGHRHRGIGCQREACLRRVARRIARTASRSGRGPARRQGSVRPRDPRCK